LDGTVTPSLSGLLSWWQSPWSLKAAYSNTYRLAGRGRAKT
jgi:hypothetical protein